LEHSWTVGQQEVLTYATERQSERLGGLRDASVVPGIARASHHESLLERRPIVSLQVLDCRQRGCASVVDARQ
jgi:hypothetical protein